MDFGNVTRLRLCSCYAMPEYKKVTWLPVILSKALFHVKSCSCLRSCILVDCDMATWDMQCPWFLCVFDVFYALVLSLVVARRRLDLPFCFCSIVTFSRCLWCGKLATLRLRVFLVLVSAIWKATCVSRLPYVRSVTIFDIFGRSFRSLRGLRCSFSSMVTFFSH